MAVGSAQANQLVPCGNDAIACKFNVKDLSIWSYCSENPNG